MRSTYGEPQMRIVSEVAELRRAGARKRTGSRKGGRGMSKGSRIFGLRIAARSVGCRGPKSWREGRTHSNACERRRHEANSSHFSSQVQIAIALPQRMLRAQSLSLLAHSSL
jgi:hypothetical protein